MLDKLLPEVVYVTFILTDTLIISSYGIKKIIFKEDIKEDE